MSGRLSPVAGPKGLSVTSFVRALLISIILARGSTALSGQAAAPPEQVEVENVFLCKDASEGARDHCSTVPIWKVDSQDRLVWFNAPVRIDRAAREPLGVFIKAFAASAVYWDGRLIGRNGIPGNSAALETPGLRDAVIPIPSDSSGPGVHRLQVQMSTMLSPFRLESPVLGVRVAPFEEALQPALRTYLPALLTAGGMLIAIFCLPILGWRQRRIASLKYLVGAALFVTTQLAAESSRAFVQFLYPAQVLRLELVLLCSSGFGLLLTAYLCRRFDVQRRKLILAVQTAAIISAVLLLPGLDGKIAWVILSSAAFSLLVSGIAIWQKKSGALPLFVMFAACLLLGLGLPSTFLDRDFYLWAFLFFALLLVQEARGIGQARETSSSEPQPLWLGSGSMRHLVAPAKIVRLAAADDYTEVFVAGASAVLHPEPLHKLLERLPSSFVRVHRSHAVNLAHLESFKRGPRSSVTLSDRSIAPVSRRSVAKLIAAISM
ncbi:MAG TPA: LytTR family DNA-binding domain-containing protein [Sphingomicrobium sp.]|nr:LytTR family DNA-binding domain-containing protein [Sphingomicrobium sp.]